jgi:dihydrolipoamide dehydrogenase
MLIREITPAIRYGATVDDLANTRTHAHPSASNMVTTACEAVPSASFWRRNQQSL